MQVLTLVGAFARVSTSSLVSASAQVGSFLHAGASVRRAVLRRPWPVATASLMLTFANRHGGYLVDDVVHDDSGEF